MTRTRSKLRGLLPHLAAAMSLILFIATLCAWWSSFDAPSMHRLRQVEFNFRTASIRLHYVTAAEELYREQLAVHAAADLVFERRLDELDQEARRIDPDDPQYQAAVHRYYDLKAERDEYRDTTPKPPVLPTQKHADIILRFVWIIPVEALLAFITCFLSWRRWEARLRRRLRRRIRWNPSEQLPLFKSARRFAFLAASLLSFVVAGGIGGLWIRSHYIHDNFDCLEPLGSPPNVTYRERTLNTFRGGAWLDQAYYLPPGSSRQVTIQQRIYASIVRRSQYFGEGLRRSRSTPMGNPNPTIHWHGVNISRGGAATHVMIAYWVVLVPFLILPILWLVMHFRLHPLQDVGKCYCGYDLTGNTSGTCPECGTPVPSKPEAVA